MKKIFKDYRILKKYTQEELAELTNLDTRTIQRIENEQRKPSLDTFRKLVKILDISDKDILDYIKKNK